MCRPFSFASFDAIVGAVRAQPQARPCLLKPGERLVHAHAVVAGIDAGNDLPLAHATAEIDAELGEPSGDLHAEDDLILGRERAVDDHGAGHVLLCSRNDAHRARRGRRFGLRGGGRCLAIAARSGEHEKSKNSDGGATRHPGDHTVSRRLPALTGSRARLHSLSLAPEPSAPSEGNT